MEGSGECCVVTNANVERQEAPEVTLVQDPISPRPPASVEFKKEETPLRERAGGVEDNSVIQQGRLLLLIPSTVDKKCIDHDPPPSGSETGVVLKVVDCSGVELGKPTATGSSQVSPKLVKPKLSKEQRDALRLERERMRAEKEKERAEAKAKKEEEKEKRRLEKQRKEEEKRERQRKREAEMKERQEKKEREEQEKKERKEKRDAEKQRKDDERKKKEEEREQAKGEKLRKEQAAQKRIVSFFHVISPKEASQNKTERMDSDFLTPFPVKPDVTLASLPRSPLRDTSHFDAAVSSQDPSVGKAYLEECKCKPRKSESKTCDDELKDEHMDVEIADNDVMITSVEQPIRRSDAKYKLIQFHTNHRPAYFGTWRKRSGLIRGRNPFKKDTGLLDYEVDSDDEWEEEEPGESLSNSEGEDGAESGDDNEEDDGFFVPHGYLSDSEGDHSGDEGTRGQDNQDLKQQKQVSKAKAWEAEFSRKCQPLKPIKIGCLWSSEGGVASSSKDFEFLRKFEAIPLVELPIAVETKGETTAEAGATCAHAESNKRRAVPEEAMPDLIRLLHKSSMGLTRLMKTFRMYWGSKVTSESAGGGEAPLGTRGRSSSPSDEALKPPGGTTLAEVSPFCLPKTPGTGGANNHNTELENASGISKRQLEKKIQSIAIKEVRPPNSKTLWYVHDAVLDKYGLDGNALSPLIPSPSVGGRSGGENGTQVRSPQTPCGSGVARKRPKGVKSLFDFVSSSGASASANKTAAVVDKPNVLQSMEIDDNSATTKPNKPHATLSFLLTNNTQVLPTGNTAPTGIIIEGPPLKKPRLDLDPSLESKSNTTSGVIVIDSDNSNDTNDKENREVVHVAPHTNGGATSIISSQNNPATPMSLTVAVDTDAQLNDPSAS